MITLSISLISLSLVYFALGMYKPEWVLFGIKKPNRLRVIVVTLFFMMLGMTMFGEGIKRKQQTQEATSTETQEKPAAKEHVESTKSEIKSVTSVSEVAPVTTAMPATEPVPAPMSTMP